MVSFGYGLAPSSAIRIIDSNDPLFNQLCREEPDVRKCMACGSCAASCTAGEFTQMNLCKLIAALQRGAWKDQISMVKNCMLCGKCNIVCPRGINTRHLILSIQKIYNIQ